MEQLPVFLNVRGWPCLVVGAGPVGAGRAEVLAAAGARVHLVAPEVGERAAELQQGGLLEEIRAGRFEESDLDGCRLVVAATGDRALNRRIVALAEARGILANSASEGRIGHLSMPAIVDRSPVLAAVSTGGASPSLARYVRARLETLIPRSFGRLAELARELRPEVSRRLPRLSDRRAFWDRAFEGSIAEMAFAGRLDDARAALRAALDAGGRAPAVGEVYLVGAGPGDPDLLTFRAMRLMQQADVVVHDRLVSPGVLALARRDAERIYAGKRRAAHTIRQPDINRLLIRLAREGNRVLRLKGGDPFVFGRGGEEIAALADEGIPFQVVPGVTAAAGCAAYAGIPLTHRDHAHACVFVTGNRKNGKVALDWPAVARPGQTIVIYMGLSGLREICAGLVAHGLEASTPAALVQQGTTENQRVVEGTLETLAARVAGAGVRPPTLVIVGHVVRLRDKLDWYRPRAGSPPARPHATLSYVDSGSGG